LPRQHTVAHGIITEEAGINNCHTGISSQSFRYPLIIFIKTGRIHFVSDVELTNLPFALENRHAQKRSHMGMIGWEPDMAGIFVNVGNAYCFVGVHHHPDQSTPNRRVGNLLHLGARDAGSVELFKLTMLIQGADGCITGDRSLQGDGWNAFEDGIN